ncbi:MAG: hypothetical protein CUN57_01180, partial [Phototrophicales bacterium]
PRTIRFREKKTGILTPNFTYETRTTGQKDRILVTTRKRIMLIVFGMIELIDLAKTPVVILGRRDATVQVDNLFDLRLYGAAERGVSRVHCQLEIKDGQLHVTDLGSSNGTYVAGKRLVPHQPYILKKGEDLALGRLPIQIMS